jgi:hypothetical protein
LQKNLSIPPGLAPWSITRPGTWVLTQVHPARAHPSKVALKILHLLFTALAILVCFIVSGRNAEEQNDQAADHRDKAQKLHPAGFAGIVETAGDDAQSGAKDCQRPNSREIFSDAGNQIEHKINYDADQNELPESFSAGSAFKAEILFGDGFNEVVDDSFNVHFLSLYLIDL